MRTASPIPMIASPAGSAVEIMVGMMAIPAMQRARYNDSLIAGTICAGGSLGTMIPPSVVAVVYASLAQVSVGELFAAMLFPGLVMVVLFIGYILLVTIMKPEMAPRLASKSSQLTTSEKLHVTLSGLVPTLLLIIAVLGSLISGIASPTEAAAVGAIGALILCFFYKSFTIQVIRESLEITVRISSMILLIVAAGTMFTGIFSANGGSRLIQGLINDFDLGITWTLVAFLVVVFILGFVLDWTANVLICVPLFLPFIIASNVDPIWFGTLVIIVIQTSYLTPPMASSIFYLLSIAPPDMKYVDICKGVIPFIVMQFITLAIVALFPELAIWLPQQIVGF